MYRENFYMRVSEIVTFYYMTPKLLYVVNEQGKERAHEW